MKTLGYYNGKFDELENMYIPMNDRVCYFGDGVYDATCSRDYKIFALDEHIDRIYNSAALLDIEVGQTKEEMKAILNEMVSKMDTGNNFVYWQLTRGGTGIRNHVFPTDGSKANLWIMIFEKQLADVNKKVNLITMEDTRFLHCNIKTLNLIPAVMTSEKAKKSGCSEAVLHRGERVTECSHSNIHIIKDGKRSIVVSSHLLGELQKVATHYGIIRHGRMLREMTSEELDADCRTYVALKAEEMKKSVSLLKSVYSRVEEDEAGYIRVYDAATPEDVLSYLYKNGISVTELKTDKIGLEEYYIDLMKEDR